MNLGLRYEMATVPTESQNRISNLRNMTDAVPHVGALFFANTTLRNFEPRVGFAWNPRGGKTLVRSGLRIFDVLPLPYEFQSPFQLAVHLPYRVDNIDMVLPTLTRQATYFHRRRPAAR